jgi:hypothetical protein
LKRQKAWKQGGPTRTHIVSIGTEISINVVVLLDVPNVTLSVFVYKSAPDAMNTGKLRYLHQLNLLDLVKSCLQLQK